MYLCIDTATLDSGISLVSESEVFGYLQLEQMNASEKIIENIDKLLIKSKSHLSDLKGIFVIKGPGSFTGLRVGISVANQFAHQFKVPIIGLTNDEWYSYRTDEKDFIYLQSMNRDEVYMVDFCHSQPRSGIYTITDFQKSFDKTAKWIGQLNDIHRKQLSDLYEVDDVRSPGEVWQKVVQSLSDKDYKKYDLIEPFYGKEPSITKAKKI